MASLIPGYVYDIFISYRQKDNKYDGWVTEFVDNLKRELEATFKEEISVYFDINPHDGLLETHDVDASLKEKLKCLIFIPIISRTYCDPKSFAWEHEFKAFIDEASKDQFGLKVKLPNGNIASRVLPVRIHDLDANDIQLCESILGSVLRGIEFIYKEPGVNRSLTHKDKEKKNLNGTNYRNQINKVALAIKEIILGLQGGSHLPMEGYTRPTELFGADKRQERQMNGRHSKSKRLAILGMIMIIVALIGGVFSYKFLKSNKESSQQWAGQGDKIAIAVMPFQNLTRDSSTVFWPDVIQTSLISALAMAGELFVRQKDNINILSKDFSLSDYVSVSKKLKADIFISGNIQKAGTRLRLNAQLVDTKTMEVLKPFEINGYINDEEIVDLADTLRKQVTDFLLISKMIKTNIFYQHDPPNTRSPESFRYCYNAYNAIMKNDQLAAIEWYKKALVADSNNFFAAIELSFVYENLGMIEESFKWRIRNYNNRDRMDLVSNIWASWAYAFKFESPEIQMKYLTQVLGIDDQMPNVYFLIGCNYNGLKLYEKAIPEFEKSLELAKTWAKDWLHEKWLYVNLGLAYQKTGQFDKAIKLYKNAGEILPDNPDILMSQAIIFLFKKDTVNGRKYIEKYISARRKESDSEANIFAGLGWIYRQAGLEDKAEQYYRKALSSEPRNPLWMDVLATFFCDQKRNLNEVPGLIDKALDLASTRWDYYNYLHTKGWALLLQGKNQEALVVLQKVWDETPYKSYGIKAHLEEAKKALL